MPESRQQRHHCHAAQASQCIAGINPDRLHRIHEQRNQRAHGPVIPQSPQCLRGVHTHNPVLACQAFDQGFHRRGIGKVHQDGNCRLLNVPVRILQGAGQGGQAGSTDFAQRRRRSLTHRPVFVMKSVDQRRDRSGIGKTAEQSGRFLSQRPVLVLQRRNFFKDTVAHWKRLETVRGCEQNYDRSR